MRAYIKPAYKVEEIAVDDIILTSSGIVNEGEATLGEITGTKGVVEALFDAIFGD